MRKVKHWKKKWSHFDLKSCGTKIQPRIPSNNCRIFKSNWLDIESYLTRYWENKWLDIESQIDSILRVKLTRYWESNWLDIESQIDSILRVKLTRYWESNWLDIESQIDTNILQLLGIPGRILVPSVTQLFRSKRLYFFFQ